MKSYKLTLYAVTTIGGQIADDQQPRPVEIICGSLEEKKAIREKAKRRNLWDKYARYYATEKDARAAINWALSN